MSSQWLKLGRSSNKSAPWASTGSDVQTGSMQRSSAFNIVFDGRFIADHFPGIGRYSYNLLQALLSLGPGYRIAVLYTPGQANTRYDLGLLAAQGAQLLPMNAAPFSPATQLLVPQLVRRMHADVYHAPYYVRPYLKLPCRSVTTLYDLIPRHFPQFVSRRAALLFDAFHRLALTSSDALITLSEHAAGEFAQAYAIPRSKLHVTAPASDAQFVPQAPASIAALRERLQLPGRYVLSLASNKPHKNIATLLAAWAQLHQAGHIQGVQLLIAGHWDARYPQARQLARHLELEATVRFMPNIAEQELPLLYAGAELFVFPSLYEGFGLPPLEAMACGTPVLCGAHSSLPEVVGQAALCVDVHDAGILAVVIHQLLTNITQRHAMAAAGLQQAALFSWENCAHATLAAYQG